MEKEQTKHTCLVVGSAHIDLFADIKGEIDVIDRCGDLTVGVGGTAFNIATNLLSLGMEVSLVTVLKKHSLFTRIVLSKFEELGLGKEGIIFSHTIGEAGFIAHRHHGELMQAVTSTPIVDVVIDADHYKDAAKDVAFIVIDLNNSVKTIENFMQLGKDVYLMGVSQPKVQKLLTLNKELVNSAGAIKGVFLNRHEAQTLLKKGIGAHTKLTDLTKIMDTLWVVTKDVDGVEVIQHGRILHQMPTFHKANNVSSFSGAGDAFAAGFLHARYVIHTPLELTLKRALAFAGKNVITNHSTAAEGNIIDNVDHVIFHDSMTNLYNRKFFEEEKAFIESSFKNRRRAGDGVAIALFDIDNFKKINDTYGHDMGDVVIKELGGIIRGSIRDHDVPIRFGGEEFLIIFHNANLETATRIANRIREKFQSTVVTHNGHTLLTTLSGGVSAYQTWHTDLNETVKAADEALYKAKNNGKNSIYFHRDSSIINFTANCKASFC